MAKDVTLILVRCVASSGVDFPETRMMNGFQWLIDMKADPDYGEFFKFPDVISFSIGRQYYQKPHYEQWRDLFYTLYQTSDNRVVVTAAAGNQLD